MRLFGLCLILSLMGLLSALPVENGKKAEEYIVEDLPGLSDIPVDNIPIMHSGQLQLYQENNTNYFFWKFAKKDVVQNRTIFWLNGGPGCSSMDGALMEAGPLRIGDDGKVRYNPGSWSEVADIVFVDQPGGTGFSYTDAYSRELSQISQDFVRFLDEYYKVFPEDIHNEIFLAGESYAGQYIPYIAKGMLERNEAVKIGKYDLQGLLIGNGWVSPNEQSLSYIPFALEAGIIHQNDEYMPRLLKQHETCQNLIHNSANSNEVSYDECEEVLSLLLSATRDPAAPKNQQCFNMYDVRFKDSYPSCGMNWPYDLVNVTPFLRNKKVMENLNLKKQVEWSECDNKVSRFFTAKHSVPAIELLPALLEKVPIILFNGDKDIICNYKGTLSFIESMKWGGSQGFSEDVEDIHWYYGTESAGYVKSERNLTFVGVYNSSHMVPFDRPEVSRSLMDLITGNFENKMGNDNNPIIVTPVYTNSSLRYAPHSGSSRYVSITTLLQFAILIVIVWGLYMIYKSNKSNKPSSILSNNKTHRKKKSVQWADQLVDDIYPSTKPTGTPSLDDSMISKVLSKFGYNNDKNGYEPTGNFEDIEMDGNSSEIPHEFIIDSDDEDGVRGGPRNDNAQV